MPKTSFRRKWQRVKCALGFHGEGVNLTQFVAVGVRTETQREVRGCEHCPTLWLGKKIDA